MANKNVKLEIKRYIMELQTMHNIILASNPLPQNKKFKVKLTNNGPHAFKKGLFELAADIEVYNCGAINSETLHIEFSIFVKEACYTGFINGFEVKDAIKQADGVTILKCSSIDTSTKKFLERTHLKLDKSIELCKGQPTIVEFKYGYERVFNNYINQLSDALTKTSSVVDALFAKQPCENLSEYTSFDFDKIKMINERLKIELDEDQIKAVKNAMNNSISVISGGPGTGKTTVLAAIAYCLSDRKIIVSYNNIALSCIGEKLLDIGIDANTMAQYFSQNAQLEAVSNKPYALHHLINNQFGKPFLLKKAIINSRSNILYTVSAASHHLSGMHFDTLIIDQANVVPLFELMTMLNSGVQRIIICGDLQQGDPVAEHSKMSDSFLYESILKSHASYFPSVELSNCYRMSPPIASFISKQFGYGALHPMRSAQLTPNLRNSCLGRFNMPILLWNTTQEETAIDRYNCVNYQEGMRYLMLRSHLIERTNIPTSEIILLTPYKKQNYALRSTLRAFEGQIEFVDNCSNREASVIILSCVHVGVEMQGLSPIGDILNDRKRLTLALSRAKDAIIILGSENYLDTLECWRPIIAMLRSNGLVFNGDDLI